MPLGGGGRSWVEAPCSALRGNTPKPSGDNLARRFAACPDAFLLSARGIVTRSAGTSIVTGERSEWSLTLPSRGAPRWKGETACTDVGQPEVCYHLYGKMLGGFVPRWLIRKRGLINAHYWSHKQGSLAIRLLRSNRKLESGPPKPRQQSLDSEP